MNTSEGLPKPTMEDWEKQSRWYGPAAAKILAQHPKHDVGRSKKGEWADWNFEEKMQPKHPAEILAGVSWLPKMKTVNLNTRNSASRKTRSDLQILGLLLCE